ncbi:HlyD family type I secretion periplasmic adaptor subunit [Bosea sp. (in: a-proteobacteria)]|uniref:HlyD family type I secretion periplasmic adaptor subunit n=1 Tax=Bosea sp. (in: a-proteobacteria) TaxID=1871050 RepID=UPI0026085F67|nr:HlyD family type I secretion periplasmic adaptor subunit [Bosea sp. (in: a-proteobacteria)]MCO5090686.1 HlyD family type I secretion periplasmic adaptor subunit [Bosea sp. (in: a-proteobacteria)]
MTLGLKLDRAQRTVARHALVGLGLFCSLVLGIGGWAVATDLSGAVIASGVVVVNSNVKKIQHPFGGVVLEVFVKNGRQVEAGEPLIKLDPTVLNANLKVISKGMLEHYARQGRLEAERDSAGDITFPAELSLRAGDAEADAVMQSEKRLFELRRNTRMGQKSLLAERSAQIQQEIEGLTRQLWAKEKESELIFKELDGVRKLWDNKLIGIQRFVVLERDAARNEGERGQLQAQIAQAKGRVAEIGLQIHQVDQELRSDVASSLREVQAKLSELSERKVAAEDQLSRTNIASPQKGFVHQLAVFAPGAVIGAGEAIMFIVPSDDPLIVEARVLPGDIDQIRIGQVAHLRFPAFNQRVTPEFLGHVTSIAPDLSTDQKSGMSYYTVQVALDESARKSEEFSRLVPGMPAEAFLQTGDRSALSYFLKPLTDQFDRSFRQR